MNITSIIITITILVFMAYLFTNICGPQKYHAVQSDEVLISYIKRYPELHDTNMCEQMAYLFIHMESITFIKDKQIISSLSRMERSYFINKDILIDKSKISTNYLWKIVYNMYVKNPDCDIKIEYAHMDLNPAVIYNMKFKGD